MFYLTRQERQVILFLLAMALVGGGVNLLVKKSTIVKAAISYDKNLGKVDLNRADARELMSIPGIGEKLAQRILEYRAVNSYFSTPEDLKTIKGISAYKYEQIKEFVMIEK